MIQFLIQILILLLLAFFIILSSYLNDKLNRLKKQAETPDYSRYNVNTPGNYSSGNYNSINNELVFNSHEIRNTDKFDVGYDIAGGYVKRNGSVVASGLSNNIKVIINGSIHTINATHVTVKGNSLGSINSTHLTIENDANNAGKINTTHLTVNKDLYCDTVTSTHVTVKGKAIIKSVRATNVKTG